MKTYYRDFYGCSACISVARDGTAKLTTSAGGKRFHNKKYKNERSAKSAMYRMSDCWRKQ